MCAVLLAMMALSFPPSEGIQAAPPEAVARTSEVTEKSKVTEKSDAAVKKEVVSAPRTGVELRDAVRAALRRWARPSDEDAAPAAHEFLALYRELRADDGLARSQREYFLNKVRMRLARLSDQIAVQVARERRLAKARESGTASPADDKAGSMAGEGAGPGKAAAASPGDPAFGGGAFRSADYGQQLVDLIQTVIRPETWDVNGGPGSIYYWYPGRALVIRQTDEVHGEIADVLDQLRRAGP
jgi:hypothetical protein